MHGWINSYETATTMQYPINPYINHSSYRLISYLTKNIVCLRLGLTGSLHPAELQLRLAQSEDSASALERLLCSLQSTLANAMTRVPLTLSGLRVRVSTAVDAVLILSGRKFHMQTAFQKKGKQDTRMDNVAASNTPSAE